MTEYGERKNFRRWIRRVRVLLVADGVYPTVQTAEKYGSDEDWRGYFDHGYSPRSALSEDYSYA